MSKETRPFWFGGPAVDQYFIDRETDTKRLVTNFIHGINTILISPRRWGKTSLVVKSADRVAREHPEIKIVMMDIFSCRSSKDFCEMFATSIIKQTSSKLEEWVENAKRLLLRLSPTVSFGADPFNDFSIRFDINRSTEDIDEILNLPEKIANDKNLHIIVCIDEFQQIGEFADGLSFQKKMRTVWQHQKSVCYSLFGSKCHMMNCMFADPGYPFYRFGDIINLKTIPTEYWVKYIMGRFEETGKTISAEMASEICRIVDNNSSYVQQFAWYVWNSTEYEATSDALHDGFNLLMSQNIAIFEKQTEDLAPVQYNYLLAVSEGITTGFSTEAVISKYNLKNSASVRAAYKALEKKELVYKSDGIVQCSDPLLPIWIKQRSLPSNEPYKLIFRP